MIVAAVPIDPPDGDRCWAFHFVNDSAEAIEEVILERVDYEYGDSANGDAAGTRFGPIAPFGSVEILRETDTELRTSVTLLVRGSGGSARVVAEVGRLYRTPGPLVPIPILDRTGKRAVLEMLRE